MPDVETAVLLEREHELQQLDRLIDDARAGRGRALFVEGPPGIGKTRLLDEARARASEQGMTVLPARPSELDREFPFGVVRQLFEPLLAGADDQRRERLLVGAAGLAVPLLRGLPGREAPATGGDPSLALFHALYWLTANLAEESPTLLVIDDVHWADASSAGFLQFLVARLEELAVLVGLAARLGEPGAPTRQLDALATDSLATVLRPAPLSDRAVGEVVASELGQSPDASFLHACHQATGGNPFLLRELLRELARDGMAPGADEAPQVSQLAPPAVARAVLLRLCPPRG